MTTATSRQATASTRAPAGRTQSRRTPAHLRRARTAALFLAPFLLLFVAMYAAPICYTVYQSLFRMHRDGLGLSAPTQVFAGLSNYGTALADPAFRGSLLRVLLIGIVQVPVMLGLALGLALLLDARTTLFKRFFRLAFFLPYALPGVIGAIMWSYLVAPGLSPITAAAHHLGLHLDLTSNAMLAPTIGNMLTWGWTGYNMLIIYSALQAIPAELSEAATMDGCSAWGIAWRIKIPLVRPALVLTTVFSIIGTAQLYNEPAILHNVAPNLSSTYTPIYAAYDAVDANNFNAAATESVILALLAFVLSFGFLKLVQRRGAAL
ncbi:carbohydrate ABC transporter permease [Streptacidiphilus jiangxiensis]|uniref:Multiple sugar transport system permease protein n=1 Tax=Streptacidiphilus jiangxiensis TaxID=235985 RepID=A0A1H7V940_STRJI|nr:sugar ABC transporter permease [Streptacidiphilus jiangxiensis]SEM05257.1 multiple sugar transport system permease protein [Streptacidiphilus jiangxiensis]